MELIYIDRLFLINLIADYLILLVSARVCGSRLRRARYLIAAVFGALYSCLSLINSFEFLCLAPIKLCSGALMSLIAYSREERLLRCTLVFFSVSALFGGAVWALSIKSGGLYGTVPYFSVSPRVLIPAFGISYAVLSAVFRRSLKAAEKSYSDIVITHGGKTLRLKALSDSGNGLYDPITGSSVLIVPAERLRGLLGDQAELVAAKPLELYDPESLPVKLRLIPYSAVGTENGLLAAFRPDEITQNGRVRDDIIIAVSPNPITGDGFDCVL